MSADDKTDDAPQPIDRHGAAVAAAVKADYRSQWAKIHRRETEDKRLRTMRWVKGRRVYVDDV